MTSQNETQREIRFRAWDKQDRRMFKVDGLSFLNQYITDEQGQHTFKFNQCYLMEYTGLTDRNGKEIYEGDIVSRFGQDVNGEKIESRHPICFGSYDNGESYDDWVGGNGWYLGQELFFRADKREPGGCESEVTDLIDPTDFEIIGNIYENPELMLRE